MTRQTIPLLTLTAIALVGCNVKDVISSDSANPDEEEASETTSSFDGNITCEALAQETGDELGYGGYVSGSSGTQCACDPHPNVSLGDSYYISSIHMEGEGMRPKRIASQFPWSSSAVAKTPNATSDGWEYKVHNSSGSATSIDGDWKGWLSVIEFSSGAAKDCEDFGPPTFKVDASRAARSSAPPSPQSGKEPQAVCFPGDTVTARFRLGIWPGVSGPDGEDMLVPVYDSGDTRYGGIDIRSVQVVDWGTTAAVMLDEQAGGHTLTPAADSATFSPGDVWLGTTPWFAELSAGDITPTIEVTGDCPASRPTHSMPQAYEMFASDLVPGLSSPQRYVLRLVPDEADPAARHLILELDGLEFGQGFPVEATADAGRWSFDHDGGWYSVTGEVEELTGGLQLRLDDAWIDGLGTVEPKTVLLPAY